MLLDVLQRVSADAGYQPTQQRTALLKLLNAAAKEIYDVLECNSILREVTLVVPINKVVALPNQIGELRGMRIHTQDDPFDLRNIGQPRYHNSTWQYKLRNWRDLGESPIHTIPNVIDVITFTSPVVESAVVTISAQTNIANKLEESVTLSSSPKSTTKMFGPAFYGIYSQSVRTCDIVVSDSDGNEIATLYASDKKTRYKLVDVSELGWSSDTSASETLIDVAYKLPLTYMINDSDSFPAGDAYDDAWYYRAMYLHFLPTESRKADAASFHQLSVASLLSMKENAESGQMKKLNFGRNKFYNLFDSALCYHTCEY